MNMRLERVRFHVTIFVAEKHPKLNEPVGLLREYAE